MTTARFDFYDVVVLLPAASLPSRLWNTRGVVVGRAESDAGAWGYGVLSFVDNHECWHVEEADIAAAGERMRRDEIYDGSRVRVPCDPNDRSRS